MIPEIPFEAKTGHAGIILSRIHQTAWGKWLLAARLKPIYWSQGRIPEELGRYLLLSGLNSFLQC